MALAALEERQAHLERSHSSMAQKCGPPPGALMTVGQSQVGCSKKENPQPQRWIRAAGLSRQKRKQNSERKAAGGESHESLSERKAAQKAECPEDCCEQKAEGDSVHYGKKARTWSSVDAALNSLSRAAAVAIFYDYTVVKKTSSERCQAPVSEGWGRPLSPITGPPPQPPIHEDINDQKILELTYKMIELLTGEVPIRCQDVTVYFSMEEWEYLEGHQDLYKDVMMEVPQPLTSPVLSSKRTTPERCPRPLLPQDCKQEDPDVPQDHQGEDLPHINTTETYVRGDERSKEEILTGDCAENFLSRMDMDRDTMAERILHLTLEILFRLTGEDYTVVKKTSSERCQAPVSEGWGRPLSPITGPPPHPPIHEDINDQKILELTYKMIELLTGEVPIRCQDVTVYFSMEEWEYLEGHKDLYKDVMMEVPQPLTSPCNRQD
ncbi:uncharacterized protein LOC142258916 [Anomaloglossus baeobatrachus]|uniref:uncharacterized protein LOC142258916 n=1 Tax=Anomaloglossus baeobatrachus TaxID=238106 RepID=UPI003F4FF548